MPRLANLHNAAHRALAALLKSKNEHVRLEAVRIFFRDNLPGDTALDREVNIVFGGKEQHRDESHERQPPQKP